MVDIDDKGGIQVFVKDLLDAGLLKDDSSYLYRREFREAN